MFDLNCVIREISDVKKKQEENCVFLNMTGYRSKSSFAGAGNGSLQLIL